MKQSEFFTNLGIWLIVAVITFFYFNYFGQMQSIGDAIVTASPALVFFAGGILIFSRDQKIIKKTKFGPEFSRNIILDWGQALKHDTLIYLIPILILALPVIMGEKTTIATFVQSIIAFLSLTYLKLIYWGEL
ncbi:MAG: hypothetical protein WC508_02780 [Patescibacteria group bacterium]